ncbi:regulator RcnB of Ni and Co efflux [Halopseudomonas sabulinigri]|uniref:Regulator RcnB of Ni and Co efflux n=1 Tax=Halopseudomonas sabulinigri TaxID=472181 RepID=A0A1H1L6F2_9GAMM|nr:anti-virulence regulator CigR family protein [Halopseudomonas sabulinigri]SDR69920.1 regulator RcnB of Ni and Co efflux [Halopseudomonas sabulinigri]
MNKRLPYLLTASVIAIALATPLQAKPDNHPGQGNNKGGGHHQEERHEQRERDARIDINDQLVRSIFRDNHQYVDSRDSLPPGIRKNLARGKPLPPGIAKQIDPRLSRQLPHYDGYDWRQAGEDAILVSVTTGIIEAIINDAFD